MRVSLAVKTPVVVHSFKMGRELPSTLLHNLQILTMEMFHSSECSKNIVNVIGIDRHVNFNRIDRTFQAYR